MPTEVTEAAEQLARLATIMAQALVDQPDEVRVTHTAGEHSILLELHVHPDVVGQLIGKRGINAAAIRKLLSAAAGKLKRSVTLEIVDPFTSPRVAGKTYHSDRPPPLRRVGSRSR